MNLLDAKSDLTDIQLFLENHNFFQKRDELQRKTEVESFWQDQANAQKVSKELANLNKVIEEYQSLLEVINNLEEVQEVLSETEFSTESTKIQERLEFLKLQLFLSGEYDNHNALLSFSVGAGGDDASDWTEMCMKMYLKYCESKNWKTEVLDIQSAEIAGIKGALVKVYGGENVYGYLKHEAGSHRMVRKSPFNSGNTRETSFAFLEVVPEIEDESTIEIDEKDLKIDTFKAQGAGGQHVNTTDSAVRITHLKTGIVVQCQNERSQMQNKRQALHVLKSRLLDLKVKENEEKKKDLKQDKTTASFGGGHIGSYVLDDQYVKDTRTNLKTSQVEKVLNGDLDEFIRKLIMQG